MTNENEIEISDNLAEYEKNFSYPDTNDNNIQSKIFNKREFYYYNIKPRKIFTTYEEIQQYRETHCNRLVKESKEHQSIIRNLINPNTPNNGIILKYGLYL